MVGKIAQIASIISALTAVTTSLRALGKSREYSHLEPQAFRRHFSVFRLSVVIWYVLSVVFAVPSLSRSWTLEENVSLLLWAVFFLFITGLIFLIWRRIVYPKKQGQ